MAALRAQGDTHGSWHANRLGQQFIADRIVPVLPGWVLPRTRIAAATAVVVAVTAIVLTGH